MEDHKITNVSLQMREPSSRKYPQELESPLTTAQDSSTPERERKASMASSEDSHDSKEENWVFRLYQCPINVEQELEGDEGEDDEETEILQRSISSLQPMRLNYEKYNIQGELKENCTKQVTLLAQYIIYIYIYIYPRFREEGKKEFEVELKYWATKIYEGEGSEGMKFEMSRTLQIIVVVEPPFKVDHEWIVHDPNILSIQRNNIEQLLPINANSFLIIRLNPYSSINI